MRTSLLASVFVIAAATQAFALNESFPDTQDMTCAQIQDYVLRYGQSKLKTGDTFASFRSGYCSGQVPGFVCTKDVAYCNVGVYCYWHTYGDLAPVNPESYMQGVESRHARRRS